MWKREHKINWNLSKLKTRTVTNSSTSAVQQYWSVIVFLFLETQKQIKKFMV